MEKLRKAFVCFLVILISAHVSVSAAGDVPSEWASAEVTEAVSMGFIPEDMKKQYTHPITREEFAEIAVRFLSVQFRLSLNEVLNYCSKNSSAYDEDRSGASFSDTTNVYVEKAYLYGIVKGRGNGIFDPESEITREEAAQMLCNTYRAYTETDIVTGSDTLAAYADRDKISDWAEDAAAFVIENDVMQGVSETEFSPGSYYTREQCYVTFLRLYKNAPCSRRYENVRNLYTYEELVDGIVNSYSYVSLYSCETETCSVFFGYHTAAPHRADTAVEIVYKKGGNICLNEQFNNNTPFLENFTLSEDEKELYCTDPDTGKKYRIDLETAKVEMVATEESDKTEP